MTLHRVLAVTAAVILGAAAAIPTPARAGQRTQAAAPSVAACDMQALARSEAEFKRQQTLRSFKSEAASAEGFRAAAADYAARADACYHVLYANATDTIDNGGLWFQAGGAVTGSPYDTFGTKWGTGSPFTGGIDVPGPGTPGGTVTYSYMANGVSMSAEGASANVAITSLPTFQACFLTEITTAMAVWSVVADIQFVQTTDNAVPFNAAGATGDIRIGAHVEDGSSGVLAHAYYPPPNGTTAAGDMHFDSDENWSCSAGSGVIDIGIVAMHEIGHSIGLDHEQTRTAMMNPFYNPALTGLLPDDINGAASIYGSPLSGPVTSDDLVVDFGPAFGPWVLYDGADFAQLHTLSPQLSVTGDLDGNGIDEILVDFGTVGLWVRLNNSSWFQLHTLSPNHMATGDLDGNGLADAIIDFPGYGVWVWQNNSFFTQLHPLNANFFTVGNLDGNASQDVILDFPGYGLWIYYNNGASWAQLHPLGSTRVVTGNFDGAGNDDIVVDFTGYGVWIFVNNSAWGQVHSLNASRLAAGDLNGGGDDLIIDFGSIYGLWAVFNGTTWGQLNPNTSQELAVGDLDGNGNDDLISDFGAAGLWAYANNSSWVQLHPANTEGLAVGDINAP